MHFVHKITVLLANHNILKSFTPNCGMWDTLDYAFLSIVRGIREVTRRLSSQESDNPSGDLELSEALDVRTKARSLIQRLVKTLEDIDTTVLNADIRSLDGLVDRRDSRDFETVLCTESKTSIGVIRLTIELKKGNISSE